MSLPTAGDYEGTTEDYGGLRRTMEDKRRPREAEEGEGEGEGEVEGGRGVGCGRRRGTTGDCRGIMVD